jgi:hypothetical protein
MRGVALFCCMIFVLFCYISLLIFMSAVVVLVAAVQGIELSCNAAGVQAAFTQRYADVDADVTFNCTEPTTVVFSSFVEWQQNMTVDGGNLLTIDCM